LVDSIKLKEIIILAGISFFLAIILIGNIPHADKSARGKKESLIFMVKESFNALASE